MSPLVEVRAFLETGGPVLVPIFLVASLVAALGFERLVYLAVEYPKRRAAWIDEGRALATLPTWSAVRVREEILSRARLELRGSVPLVRTLTALAPLLGLLGTVTGMIEVFDVVAFTGTGSPRALSAGIYRATIPTMAGLVVALTGLAFRAPLEHAARRRSEALAEALARGPA